MDRKIFWFSIVLAILGVLVAAYMTIYKLTANDTMCLGSGDCSTVNASPYSEVYGIPVALVGLGGYLAILATLLLERYGQGGLGRFFSRNGTMINFGLGLTGFAFTLWLIYAEIYLIKAICPFCLASQVIMSILFALLVVRLIRQPI
jgi:uncharacterized membrane protein